MNPILQQRDKDMERLMKEETNSNQHQQNCWFYDHKVSLGFCTYYGACRVGQQDFMYQVNMERF